MIYKIKEEGLWNVGRDRTVEEINHFNQRWIDETGADPSKLKDYFNCKNKSLLKANNSGATKVIEACSPPPLHTVKLGPVNGLLDLLTENCPEETKEFLLENHITKEAYHGGELEGGQFDKLLKKIDYLEDTIPDEHKSILDGFAATDALNKAVCGKFLEHNYEEAIKIFEDSMMFLQGKYGMSITPKIHILITHVPQYIRLTGKSLGFISDQTIENAHQIVNKRMESSNYYVKAVEINIP